MTDNTSYKNMLDRLLNCVHSGMEWSVKQIKSACPPKKEKPKKKFIDPKSKKAEEETDIGPPCTEKQPYKLPSQICPKMFPCYIKMQDPYAPCCCEAKPQPLPCPPKSYLRQSRKATCECDLCKKSGIESKCCPIDKNSIYLNRT